MSIPPRTIDMALGRSIDKAMSLMILKHSARMGAGIIFHIGELTLHSPIIERHAKFVQLQMVYPTTGNPPIHMILHPKSPEMTISPMEGEACSHHHPGGENYSRYERLTLGLAQILSSLSQKRIQKMYTKLPAPSLCRAPGQISCPM